MFPDVTDLSAVAGITSKNVFCTLPTAPSGCLHWGKQEIKIKIASVSSYSVCQHRTDQRHQRNSWSNRFWSDKRDWTMRRYVKRAKRNRYKTRLILICDTRVGEFSAICRRGSHQQTNKSYYFSCNTISVLGKRKDSTFL